jgi:O-antigen/teichoic acid export membrane protein
MALSVIIARSLTVDSMGKYQYYLSFIVFFRFITLPGMNTAITKGVLKGYEPFLFTAIKKALKVSIIFSIGCIIVAYIIYIITNDYTLFIALLIVSVFIPLRSIQKFDPFITGKKKFFQSRIIVIISTIIQFITLSTTVYLTKNIHYLIIALFVSNMIGTFLQYIVAKHYYSPGTKDKSVERKLYKMGMKFSFLQVFNQIVGSIDRIILGTMSPSYLAIYHIGSLFPRVIKDNIKVMLSVPIIHWGSGDKKENLLKIKKYGLPTLLLGFSITALIWMTADNLIMFFYGEKYFESIIIVKLLSLSIGLRFLSGLIEFENIYQSDGRFYAKQLIIIKSLYLLFLVIFISKFQVMGAVYAFLLTDIITFTTSLIYFIKTSKAHINT